MGYGMSWNAWHTLKIEDSESQQKLSIAVMKRRQHCKVSVHCCHRVDEGTRRKFLDQINYDLNEY